MTSSLRDRYILHIPLHITYCNMNNNNTLTVLDQHKDNELMPTNIVMICIASLTMFGITFGNMLTIIAVCKYETLKTVGNSFIVSWPQLIYSLVFQF